MTLFICGFENAKSLPQRPQRPQRCSDFTTLCGSVTSVAYSSYRFVMTLFILLNLFSALNTGWFETIPAAKSGVTFIHDNAISPDRYQPESMGPGVAIFDYDNDGWMDLYFVNSGPCDFFRPARPFPTALYPTH